MMKQRALNYSHQDRLFNPAHAQATTVIGVGSVGSQVAVMLAKLGAPELTLYDADAIESHNLPMTTVFGLSDLGRRKVEVVGQRIGELAGSPPNGPRLKLIARMYESETLVGSVVCCADNMEARSAAWSTVRLNPNVDLFVDTRTHERYLSIFAIRPCEEKDIAYYEHHLYPTSATERPACGRHGLVNISAMAACIAVNALTGLWSGDIPARHQQVLQTKNGLHLYGTPSASKEGGSR